MPSVHYFYEDVNFTIPKPRKTARWIKEVIILEKKSLDNINYIFCSDKYLLDINNQFLNHATYTDIITFDNSEGNAISADIYISIDRIRDNAAKFCVPFLDELHRVLIHGVLHLIGYKDKSTKEKQVMRKSEDAYLSLR